MLNKWFTVRFTVNMEDGNAEEIKRFDSEKEAMDSFYNQLSSYGTNPNTKVCEVIVIDTEGSIRRVEKIDNSKYITPIIENPLTEEE